MAHVSATSTLRRTLVHVFGAVLAMTPAYSLHAQSEQAGTGLQGTWWVQLTQYDCANPDITRPPFVSLLAFARGGTMSETTANAAFQPGQRSSGYGTWKQTSDGSYSSSDLAFILFTGGLFTQGTQRIDHSIALADDGSQFSDVAIVQFFDIHGTLLVQGCARAVGTRIQ